MTLNINLKTPIHNLKRGGKHVLVLLENGEGKILLTGKPQYPKGMFRLPGGGVDKDERIEDATVREVMEELGVKAEDVKILVAINIVGISEGKEYPLTQYIAYAKIGDQKVNISDKELNYLVWINIDGLQKAVKVFASLTGEWEDYGKVYGPVHKIAYDKYKEINN